LEAKVNIVLPRVKPGFPCHHGPLSLVNITSVLSSRPNVCSDSRISPTLQSSSSTASPYRPAWDRPRNSSEACLGSWGMGWASNRKKGSPWCASRKAFSSGESLRQQSLIDGCLNRNLPVPVDRVRPDVVAGQHTVKRVKASTIGQVTGLVPQMPFPQQAGAVAPPLQHLRQEHLLQRTALHPVGIPAQDIHQQVHRMPCRVEGVCEVGANRIPARQQPRPRRRTEGRRGIEAGQARIFGGHAGQVRAVDGLAQFGIWHRSVPDVLL
jgi:hypothetical protein